MPDDAGRKQQLRDELRDLSSKVAELESRLAKRRVEAGSGAPGEVARERERLIEIMESTTDGVSTSTPDGWILYMNRAGRRLLGLGDDEDLSTLRVRDLHPPEAAQAIVDECIPEAVAKGSCLYETLLLRRDGTEIPVSQVILSHKLPNGAVEYLSTIVRDMTDRIVVGKALAESEEKFRSIIQASPMGVHMYELKADGRLVFIGANPAADELLGVDNSQFIGKTIEEAFPSLVGSEVPERYRRAAAEGTPWRTSQINYEDERIAGAFEVQAFQTSPGRMAAMFLDITNRLQAEQALRESERRYRELFESMAQGVVYHSAEGRIVMANPAAERIFGLSQDDMIGRTSMDPRWRALREDGSELPGQDQPAMESLRTGRPANAVMAVFNEADETFHWIDMYATPQFREGESTPYQVFTTFTDITERRLAHRRRAELEQQLRQAQKMEAVGQLAGGIAHDFNNLLTTIAGYSELMWEEGALDDQLRADLGEIRKAADRASALTQQLLAFSRKQIISPRVLDLNTRVQEDQNLIGRLIGETIDLNLDLNSEPCLVEADPTQIDQILINLAVNARDAMSGGGQLSISTGRMKLDEEFCRSVPDLEPGEFAALTVSDNGHGMNEETLSRIFEPFFTTKDYGKGTGLGLSTVYGIVKQNGGAIKISSQLNVGTTVRVFLPRVDAAPEDPSQDTKLADLLGSETILLVEDEESVRSLTDKLLKSRGYRVLRADSPEGAAQIARDYDGEIDLLLTDVVMPRMNGRELFHQMKKLRPRIKVLYMSGYAEDVIAKHGVLERDTSFVSKPFTAMTLAAKVREALKKEA
jgi:PAS domain S-box-containing protein